MEFERRTKRGMAAEKKEQEDAQRYSDAIQEGENARQARVVEDFKKEEEERMKRNQEQAASSSSSSSRNPSEETLHNLSAAQQLLSAGGIQQASAIPLRLNSIRIEGVTTLRKSFLKQLCKPYIDPSLYPTLFNKFIYSHRLEHVLPGQYTSLSSILSLTQSLGTDLTSMDLFSDIDATLQASKNGSSVEDVDIVLACKERGNYFLKTSTDVGNGEGNATIQAKIRNCFGGAERVEISATMGTKTRRAFNASLVSPLFASPDHSISLSSYALDRDLTSYSSLIEGIRGVRIALQSQLDGGRLGNHEIGFDIMHRHLSRLLPTASLGIRRQAGHSIKSSLSHLYTYDSRDDPFLATKGHYNKVFQEWAGFGGDTQHYKIETESQFSRCFLQGWAFSLTARAGLLRSLNNKPPLFCDRFQLGGPISIRMFRYNSLGPKDSLDSLGGDMYYSFGASLFAPVPTKPQWPLKFHSFFNAGQVIQLDPSQSMTSVINRNLIGTDLIARPSSSAGLGLMYRQGNLRAEINFGVPLTMRVNDGAQKGFQLGIGITFM